VQAVGLQFTLRQGENFSPSRHQTFYFFFICASVKLVVR